MKVGSERKKYASPRATYLATIMIWILISIWILTWYDGWTIGSRGGDNGRTYGSAWKCPDGGVAAICAGPKEAPAAGRPCPAPATSARWGSSGLNDGHVSVEHSSTRLHNFIYSPQVWISDS